MADTILHHWKFYKRNNTYTYNLSNRKIMRPLASLPKPSLPPVDSPERRRLPPLLRRAWYGLNQAFRRRIAHTRVTPDQFTVMRTLLEGDPQGLTQSGLTQAMSSDPNTVASLLERMESAGWIERQPHEKDRRAHRIRLLPAGKRKYVEVRQIAVALQTEVLAVVPEAKREEFLVHLTAVADTCRTAADNFPKKQK
jgi:DNA-binding MarR family transcriptional regulator